MYSSSSSTSLEQYGGGRETYFRIIGGGGFKCVILTTAKAYILLYFQQSVTLGMSSLTLFGAPGVALEVILIAFLFVCSLVGLYTIPGIRRIRPTAHGTTLTQIILNCGLYVILSSALPLLAKILGNMSINYG